MAQISCRGCVIDFNENGLNKDYSHDELSMNGLNMDHTYEEEFNKAEEKALLQASNLFEYYELMRAEGIPLQNDGAPVKIRDVGRSGVVIMTNYGTISTTENLPDSIREEIESAAVDRPDIMNEIESALKAKEIDCSISSSVGRSDYAVGKIDIEHENPEAGAYMDTASNRKEATRDILESSTYGNYSEDKNNELANSLDEEEKRRLRLEFEEKYGNSTRGNEGREIGE